MVAGLHLSIDLDAPTPIFRQIADQLRHVLVTGDLLPGAQLPSVRRLAIDLGVHHNTVAEAYRLLATEEWLDVTQGKAVRVVDRREVAPPPRSRQRKLRESFHRRLQHLVAEMRASGLPTDWIEAELRAAHGTAEDP